MNNNIQDLKEQLKNKNEKILSDPRFYYLLTVGDSRRLLADDIIIHPLRKKVGEKIIYFYMAEIDGYPYSLLNIDRLQATVLIYYRGRTKIGIKTINYRDQGIKLADRIIQAVPKYQIMGISIVGLKDIDNIYDIIVYRHNGSFLKILEEVSKSTHCSTEVARSLLQG